MDEKKLVRIKSRYGVDLMDTQIFIDNKPWIVCGLARQEHRNNYIWQWWIIMPDKTLF